MMTYDRPPRTVCSPLGTKLCTHSDGSYPAARIKSSRLALGFLVAAMMDVPSGLHATQWSSYLLSSCGGNVRRFSMKTRILSAYFFSASFWFMELLAGYQRLAKAPLMALKPNTHYLARNSAFKVAPPPFQHIIKNRRPAEDVEEDLRLALA